MNPGQYAKTQLHPFPYPQVSMGYQCVTTEERSRAGPTAAIRGILDRQLPVFGLTLRISERNYSNTNFWPDPGIKPGSPSGTVAQYPLHYRDSKWNIYKDNNKLNKEVMY